MNPESVWPLKSLGWPRRDVSGPARPGEPGPVLVAKGQSGSASCRILQSGCTQALKLRRQVRHICTKSHINFDV